MSTELQVALFSAALLAAGWIIVRIENLGRVLAKLEANVELNHESLAHRVSRIEAQLDQR